MRIPSKIAIAFSSFLMITPLYAAMSTFNGVTELASKVFEQLTINGPSTLTEIKADTLDAHGPLTFDKVNITESTDVSGPMRGQEGSFGKLNVTGPLEAQKITCDTLTVIGPAALKYFTVRGNTDIMGSFASEHGNLQDLTFVSSGTLTNTNVKNITVKPNKAEPTEKEILELKGTTIVTGDIIFTSGKGEVNIQGKDVTFSGKIKGGVLKTSTASNSSP